MLHKNFVTNSFDRTAKLIPEAWRVMIYGVCQFHSFEAFLTIGLRLIRSDVLILDANALGITEEIGPSRLKCLCYSQCCTLFKPSHFGTPRHAWAWK